MFYKIKFIFPNGDIVIRELPVNLIKLDKVYGSKPDVPNWVFVYFPENRIDYKKWIAVEISFDKKTVWLEEYHA